LYKKQKSLAEVIKPSRRDSLQIKSQKHKANFWQFLEKERERRGDGEGYGNIGKEKGLGEDTRTHTYTKTERRIIIS
jgi:hypothetical protein